MKNLIVSILLIIIANCIFAQQWETTNFPSNCQVLDVNFIDANTGWLVMRAIGNPSSTYIYKTIDKGISWNNISDGFDQVWDKLNFINNNTGFIASEEIISKTINGGYNWSTVLDFAWHQVGSVKFVNAQTGYALFYGYPQHSAGATIYKTTNCGNSWFVTSINGFLPSGTSWIEIYDVDFCPENINILIACGKEQRYDHGQTDIPILIKTSNGFMGGETFSEDLTLPYSAKYLYVKALPNTTTHEFRLLSNLTVAQNNDNTSINNIVTFGSSQDPRGLSFSGNSLGFVASDGNILVTNNGGYNLTSEYNQMTDGYGMSSFGDVVYQGGHGYFYTRKIQENFKTNFDLVSQTLSNAFTMNGISINTPYNTYIRGGTYTFTANKNITYNNVPYVFYKWTDNSTNYDNVTLGNSHYYIWSGDISAYYKGKLLSTSPNSISNANQIKSIKDTVLNGVNTIHMLNESQGGVFYTKSNDNGSSYLNEEVVNFSDLYNDADGNKNASLTIIRYTNGSLPYTVIDPEHNVAACWERYNQWNGNVELKVSERITDVTLGTHWIRYQYSLGPNYYSFSAPSNFEAKPKVFVSTPPGTQNDDQYITCVTFLKYENGQSHLMIHAKSGGYSADYAVEGQANITSYAVTSPFNYFNQREFHFVYIMNNKVIYKKVYCSFTGGSGGGFGISTTEGPTDLTTGVDALQNKGDLDITLRNASDNPTSSNLKPVIAFKGQYAVIIKTPVNQQGPGGGNNGSVTYYPVVWREKLYNNTWSLNNSWILSTSPQGSCNIEGAIKRNSYVFNYATNGNNIYNQRVPRWNNLLNSYHCVPASFTGTDAKFIRNALIDENSTQQKLLTLSQTNNLYQIGNTSYQITQGPSDDPDEISAVAVADNVMYMFNLGSIIINSQQVNFNVPDDSIVIEDPTDINDAMCSNPFLLNDNDTLILGKSSFYLNDNGSFHEVIYTTNLMRSRPDGGQYFCTLSIDTLHAGDSVDVESLFGYILNGFGSDSFYVQLAVDTLFNIDDGDITGISGGFSAITGGNGGDNLNRPLKDFVFFKNPIKSSNNAIPIVFNLHQNYPNPFNPVTKIKYDIPKTSLVTIKIYDILGREVSTLVNETKQPGYYEAIFNGNNLASGIYFYRIVTDKFTSVKKMVLVK